MDSETLAQRVRRLRKERGLSQDALARAFGGTRQNVYDIERGKQQLLKKHNLEAISAALKVHPSYLLYGYDPPPTEEAEWPPLRVALRNTTGLSERDLEQVERIIRALEAHDERAFEKLESPEP